ncbi:transposase [Singulisphaera sp. PoT]|uniref:transposase n=1 Tax=Singulisphaera sp. PoT TaxID=3411797 RepID=UPI003BF4A8D1
MILPPEALPLRTVGDLAPGHRTDYRRVLSRAPWSGLRVSCTLARPILDRLCPLGPVFLVGDDTVDGHPGRCVYGKARHRDPVRSSHAYTAREYGHRRVVLAVLVRLPGTGRPRALPVLVDLYRSEEDDRRRGHPHRTPVRLMCRPLRALMMEFPRRRFVFVGGSGYGSHDVARLCHRHRPRLSPVSKLHPEANLFDPPPPYGGKGRPRVKGAAGPSPARAWRPRGAAAGSPWAGTAAAAGGSRSSPARGTGTRRARGRCRSAGSSSTTGRGRIATSTSTRPTRRWGPARS